MSKVSQKERLRALYGRSADEDRNLDLSINKSLLGRYQVLLVVVSIIAVCLLVVCYRLDSSGYAFGIGQYMNGERYYGFIKLSELEERVNGAPVFSYMNVLDIIIVGGVGIVSLYIVLFVSIRERISDCKRSISAYHRYMKEREREEFEERLRQQELLHNKISNAPRF